MFDALTKEGERIYCLDTWIRLDYWDQNDQQGLGQIDMT